MLTLKVGQKYISRYGHVYECIAYDETYTMEDYGHGLYECTTATPRDGENETLSFRPDGTFWGNEGWKDDLDLIWEV